MKRKRLTGLLLSLVAVICLSADPLAASATKDLSAVLPEGGSVEESPLHVTALTNADHTVSVDVRYKSEGSVAVSYLGSAGEALVRIICPDGGFVPYPLAAGQETVCSLTGGSGLYRIIVYEGDAYGNDAVIFEETVEASLSDEFSVWLNPNLYVPFTKDSAFAAKAASLYEEAGGNPAAYAGAVYSYLISAISYDEDLAADLPAEYLPDPDRTFLSGKGICYDYASLMTAMLRSVGVPARMHVGYFGAYAHAWVSAVVTPPHGGGKVTWKVFDPTLGAGNPADEVAGRIARGTDYISQYQY